MAASYLITSGVPFSEAKKFVDAGTAVEEAKKAIPFEINKLIKRFPEFFTVNGITTTISLGVRSRITEHKAATV